MACTRPLKQYLSKDGEFTFNPHSDFGTMAPRELQCGNCRSCRTRRAGSWSIRQQHEAAMHAENYFVTLTFAADPVTISKKDLQLFFKRLRKAGKRFRYYACGEYGEKLGRPHYHVNFFGLSLPDREIWQIRDGRPVYRSETIEKAWPFGYSEVEAFASGAGMYVANYVQKKRVGKEQLTHYRIDVNGVEVEVTPEFQLQSIRPPLGTSWLEKYWRDVYPADFVVVGGHKFPVPRAYDKWLEKNQPEIWREVREKRLSYAKEQGLRSEADRRAEEKARDAYARNLTRQYEGL
jgi:hypothetical protein